MNKKLLIIGAVVGVLVIIGIVLFSTYINYSNKEILLKNLINAKMEDNKNEYDNMWKKIKQVAKVADKDRETLMQIFIDHAKARTATGNNEGSLMKWVQESVPSIDNSTYKSLMNIITSSRDSWVMRQKELIDFKREHDNVRTLFPGSLFLSGRPEIKIQIITSIKTEDTFKTGKEDDVEVFDK